MAVQTPGYWQEEKYQPLVEVETAYGNKVKIPESLLDTLKIWKHRKEEILRNIEQAKAEGFFKKTIHNQNKQDLKRVYFEQFQE